MAKRLSKKGVAILLASVGMMAVIGVITALALGLGNFRTATINGCVFEGLTLEEAREEYYKGNCPKREIEITSDNGENQGKSDTVSKIKCSTDEECYREMRDKLSDEAMFIELYNRYDYPVKQVEELIEGKLGLNHMYEGASFRIQSKISRSNIDSVDGRYLTLKDLTADYSPGYLKDLMIERGLKTEAQTSGLEIEIDFMSILETYDRDFHY